MLPVKYENKIIDKILYVMERAKVKVIIEILIKFDVIEIRIVTPDAEIYDTVIKEIKSKSKHNYQIVENKNNYAKKSWYVLVEFFEGSQRFVYQKNISAIKYGLYNLFHGDKNLIASDIDSFVTQNLEGAKVSSVESGDIALDKEQIRQYYQEKRALALPGKKQANNMSEKRALASPGKKQANNMSEIFPKYKPTYSAEQWKEISQKAYEKRQQYYSLLVKK
jgi:uncharacterized Fe-S radical SAM superfamily protein PflX